jgi:hypothetical protein
MRTPVKKALVRQSELMKLDNLERSIASYKKQMSVLVKKWEEIAAPIMGALLHGESVEPGLYTASIKYNERRSVAWKEQYIAKLGEAEAQRVLDMTTPSRTPELVVSRGGE